MKTKCMNMNEGDDRLKMADESRRQFKLSNQITL